MDILKKSEIINPILIFLIFTSSLFARSTILGDNVIFYFYRFIVLTAFILSISWGYYKKKTIYYLSLIALLLNITLLLNLSCFKPERVIAHLNIMFFIIGAITLYVLQNNSKVNTSVGVIPIIFYLLFSWKQLYEHTVYLKLNLSEISTYIAMSYRFEGILQNANESVLTYLVGIIISWLFFSKKKNNTVYLILLIMFIPIVFASGSKKGFLLFFGTILLMINKKTLLPIGLILIIGVFFLGKFKDEIFVIDRFITLKDGQDGSSQHRAEYIQDGIKDFEKSIYNLIVGFGPNSFEEKYGKYSHNNYVEITYTYGLFSLLFYLWVYYLLFNNYLKNKDYSKVLIVFVVFILNTGWVLIYDITGICLLIKLFLDSIQGQGWHNRERMSIAIFKNIYEKSNDPQ